MDKIIGCGLEVSARELVVALEDQRVQRYANPLPGIGSCWKLSRAGGGA